MSDRPADNKIYTFVNVIFKEDDDVTYCYIADEDIHACDLAAVNTNDGIKYTLVAYLTRATAKDAPYPFEKLKHITARVPKGSPDYAALYDKYLKRRPRFSDDLFYPDDFYDD